MNARWITASLLTLTMAACADNRNAAETQAPPADSQVEPAATDSQAGSPAPTAAPAPLAPAPAAAPKARAARAVTTPSRPPAAAAPAAPRDEYRTIRVPAGTLLALELLTPLSTETVQVEAPVRARLKQGISVDGLAILPAGTELSGSVTEAEGAGRVKGRAHLAFAFTEATVAGAREKLRTEPLTFDAKSTKGKDAAKIGIGAGAGAVIGGILGGGSGAAKGAAIGGGAGTGVVLATKGDEVVLEAGAELPASLAEPFEMKLRVK